MRHVLAFRSKINSASTIPGKNTDQPPSLSTGSNIATRRNTAKIAGRKLSLSKMAQSLSDEEFSRMQVLWQIVIESFPTLTLKILISLFIMFQTQLIELRTLNYELEANCQKQQGG